MKTKDYDNAIDFYTKYLKYENQPMNIIGYEKCKSIYKDFRNHYEKN